MTPLDLDSEHYSPRGNVAGQGVRRQLGRPAMDPLALLVRESAQNSWDARLRHRERITYGVDVHSIEGQELEFLRSEVFAERPRKLPFEELDERSVLAITVYDRGTSGLGGPVRANEVSDDEDSSRDFVNFLCNVGQPPDQKEKGGGTYGYGKAAFYLQSPLRTVCVHTRTREGQRRFMAAALGDQYTATEGDAPGLYTGRHWWGEKQSDGIVDPVTGERADSIARQLGMPVTSNPDETGTTVTVLAPDLGERSTEGRVRSPREAATFMAEAVLWYLWPKMLETSRCKMQCEVRLDGSQLSIPAPDEYPPLKGFVESMRAASQYRDSGETTVQVRHLEELSHGLYNHRLGIAAVNVTPRSSRQPLIAGTETELNPVGGSSHHVALMRSPELVVRYLSGPELPSEMLEYCGVFRADDNRNDSFAAAEPPAHDDWIPDSVEDRRQASNVRVALRDLKDLLNRVVEPHSGSPSGSRLLPLGAFARSLGSLLPTSGSGGGESPHPSGSSADSNRSSTGTPSAKVRTVGQPEYGTGEDGPVIRFFFEVDLPDSASGAVIDARPLVAVDDGSTIEKNPPQGTELPEIVSWTDSSGETRPSESSIKVRNPSGRCSVTLTVPEDASVGIDLSAEPVTGA